ncbi:MAG: N-acetylneuraminate synthase family protein [Treponema sp.]|nr:N-acetylneuraminate synthase family protein [Treponema sp.]
MIVAEIGTSHGGSFEKAAELIDAAAAAGTDAVKFQWVYADEILHPDTGFVKLPGGSIRLYDRFKQLEVSSDFYARAADYARSKGVEFICSPFGLRSLHELLDIHPDAVKIASPELNHIPLLEALAAFRARQKDDGEEPVPVIISSGVSKLADMEKALTILGKERVTLLHCITSYPAPETEYNVRLVGTLSSIFGIPCGISDHSLDPVLVPALAAAAGGVMTEKHITLSKSTDGLDDPVALEPEQFAQMVHAVNQCEAALRHYGKERGYAEIIKQTEDEYGTEKVLAVLGTGIKTLAPAERANYGRTNRSLHFMHDMPAGELIGPADIGVLRTEKILTPGISPEYLKTVTGAYTVHTVTAGAGVQWEDVIKK